MQGLHLTGDLTDCACSLSLLRDSGSLRRTCMELAAASGLTVVGDHFHTFADAGGVTGLLLLAESHLAVHTWPELAAVTLDVYVCNFQGDNSAKAQSLMNSLIAFFKPKSVERNALHRGYAHPHPTQTMLTEWLTAEVSHGFARVGEPTVTQSAFQKIEVQQTRAMGRMMVLDGAFMLSERDEFIYHECMVHVPALAHPQPRRALVMGGGDGCIARELLKHASIASIEVAELDAAVVDVCRRELSDIGGDALSDPRVHLHIGDALAYLRDSATRYDVIVMDLTDPGDADAAALYSRESYAQIRDHLTEEGVLSLHIGSAFFHPQRFGATLRELREVFGEVHAYKAFMPAYGAEWGMACASMQTNPAAIDAATIAQRLTQREISDLRFYSPLVHASLFAWPGYAERLGA